MSKTKSVKINDAEVKKSVSGAEENNKNIKDPAKSSRSKTKDTAQSTDDAVTA